MASNTEKVTVFQSHEESISRTKEVLGVPIAIARLSKMKTQICGI